MSNVSIYFYPKRAIIASNPPTDQYYQINLSLSGFDMSPEDSQKTSVTMSGIARSVDYYSVRQWAIQSMVNLNDSGQATTEEMQMFLQSTRAAEIFLITDLDDSDNLLEVQRQGSWSQSRESAIDVGVFGYSFNVREAVNP